MHDTRRLTSWTEIATYLGRTIRTAQRYSQNGMPVHRHPETGEIFAYVHEIEEWRNQTIELPPVPGPAAHGIPVWAMWTGGAVAGVLILLAGLVLGRWTHPVTDSTPKPAGKSGGFFPAPVRRIPVGNQPHGVVEQPEMLRLVVANYQDASVTILEPDFSLVGTLPVLPNPHTVAAIPGTSLAAVSHGGGALSLIDTKAVRISGTPIQVGPMIHDLTVTPDARFVYIAAGRAGLKRLDLTTRTLETCGPDGYVSSVALPGDGKTLVAGYQGGGPGGSHGRDAMGVFDAATCRFQRSLTGLPNAGSGIRVLPDGGFWVHAGDTCTRPRYDHAGCPIEAAQLFHRFGSDLGLVRSIGAHIVLNGRYEPLPESNAVFMPGVEAATIVDAESFKPLAVLPEPMLGHAAKIQQGSYLAVTQIPARELLIYRLRLEPPVFRAPSGAVSYRGLPQAQAIAIVSSPDFDPRVVDVESIRIDGEPPARNAAGHAVAYLEPIGPKTTTTPDLVVFAARPGSAKLLTARTITGLAVRSRIQ
ncbi:MAG: hypothetical protein FJW40_11150 [Acidobacteria bacterium]|nr:hypothetical protein [Acidobacteriota bacterium]